MINKFIRKCLVIFSIVCIFVNLGYKCLNAFGKNTSSIQQRAIAADSISKSSVFSQKGKIYIIDNIIDLNGSEASIADGGELSFKGGIIRNGILVGNNTRLYYSTGVIFDNVIIKGSWICPNISTSMFADLSKDNDLQNVFALASNSIDNVISIENANYWLFASESAKECVRIPSCTKVINNGTISFRPNDLKSYSMLYIRDAHNITITGNGKIQGDRYEHTGTTGEWGTGIKIMHSSIIKITGQNISRTWGDGIYIGKDSRNITIESCQFDELRRLGIAIIWGRDISVMNCCFRNISGTNPQCAIDIEPNRYQCVDNVTIDSVKIMDCEGGLKISGSKGLRTSRITYNNCDIKVRGKRPFILTGCESVKIKNTVIRNEGLDNAIRIIKVKNVDIDNVTIYGTTRKPYYLKQCGNSKISNITLR